MITSLHAFGWANEAKLKESIEKYLECDITKTADRYATFDWETPLCAIELKSRPGKSSDYDDWLIPTAKLTHPEGKYVFLFYYWQGDNTLWVCEPEKWCQDEWVSEVPTWKTSQLHTYIDSAYFFPVPIIQTPPQTPRVKAEACSSSYTAQRT